ncbi:MAG: hypothetical protein RMK19_06595 [Bacteroidia bacterium]|nr:hypothetical protein [Bacteroidia bacterium]
MGYYYSFRPFAYACRGFLRSGFLSTTFLLAQAPDILRFIPGRYREDNLHQIDLYNPHSMPLELSGWLLVTREYSVRLPSGLVLQPGQQLRIGKTIGDFRLEKYPDFLIRFPEDQGGAYVVLLDERGRARRGLYLAPLPQVLFLPDSGVNITQEGKRIPFYVPSETAPIWEYVQWEPDPITGVVKMGGVWRYTVADAKKEARLYAPVRFLLLIAAYERGVVHLTWEVEGREPCMGYELQRQGEDRMWVRIARFPCPSPGPNRVRMEYYDPTAREGSTYRYRLLYESPPALRMESVTAEVKCIKAHPPLQIAAQPGYLRLRLAQRQPLKIRLLDAHFAERLRIYDGWLNEGVENVFVWDTQRVPDGCWLVIWTPGRRYWFSLCAR